VTKLELDLECAARNWRKPRNSCSLRCPSRDSKGTYEIYVRHITQYAIL